MQQDRVVCMQSEPTDDEIFQVVSSNLDCTVLVVSRRVCITVNNAVIKKLFENITPLACVACDDVKEAIPIYKHIRVTTLINLDKATLL